MVRLLAGGNNGGGGEQEGGGAELMQDRSHFVLFSFQGGLAEVSLVEPRWLYIAT
jgi:hypothetical protein